MSKEKKREMIQCPNCQDTGKFDDDGEIITCPCQALKE